MTAYAAEKLRIAEDLVATLAPHCERIDITGALRRQAPRPKDIDIVCEPRGERRYQTSMFTGNAELVLETPAFDEALRLWQTTRKLNRTKHGPRFVQLQPPDHKYSIDIFIVRPPAQYGAILAIRTGPSGFSTLCVTSRVDGGAMPISMRQHEGKLWRLGEWVETPTEESWFGALGIPYWEPEERTEERLRQWLAERRRQRG